MWPVIFFWLILTLGLGFAGPVMALWSDTLYINEEINTGDIDPVFTEFETYGEKLCCCSCCYETEHVESIDISDDRKSVTMDFKPFKCLCIGMKYTAVFNYEITNEGTVPVKLTKVRASDERMKRCCPIVLSSSNRFIDFDDQVLDPGESVEGELTVRLARRSCLKDSEADEAGGEYLKEDSTEDKCCCKSYSFDIDLEFEQWNSY